jgi:hypothetical protein
MKTLIIALSVFLAVHSMASAQEIVKSSQKETQKGMYACPMHPKERSSKEGACNKCGMKMTPEKGEKPAYSCPMHPDEMSSKDGECSKCGMKLVKTLQHDTSGKGKKTAVVSKYICKMDGTTSDKSGKCSKCGMQMTLKRSDKKEANYHH